MEQAYKDLLKRVSVIGASGKMGRGITSLILMEMSRLMIVTKSKPGTYWLNAIDLSETSLIELKQLLKTNITKFAEKNISELKKWYKESDNIIDNSHLINQYTEDSLSIVHVSKRIENSYDSDVVFEAVYEDIELKTSIYKKITTNNPNATIFTNTSSIPITKLDTEANLNGNIIGFHLYTPPLTQKLMEIVRSEHSKPELQILATNIATAFNKKAVFSNDKAGFIGNGFFMRELMYALSEVSRLTDIIGLPYAIYLINHITKNILVRPMGIFELVDHIGVNTVNQILKIMQSEFTEENFHHPVIDKMDRLKITGGQDTFNCQKPGFFKYKNNSICGIYDFHTKEYIEIDIISENLKDELINILEETLSWNNTLRSKNREELLKSHFERLFRTDSLTSEITYAYLKQLKNISEELINKEIAYSTEDIDTVLSLGFNHLFGSTNNYIETTQDSNKLNTMNI